MGTSADGWMAEDETMGQYGVPTEFGPYSIADGPVSFVITDKDDDTCLIVVTAEPPAPCSEGECEIMAEVMSIDCDDQGTPDNADDDVFTFDITVTGNGGEGSGWTDGNINGSYGVATLFGPYFVNNGPVSIIITDLDDPNCSTEVVVEPPTVEVECPDDIEEITLSSPTAQIIDLNC